MEFALELAAVLMERRAALGIRSQAALAEMVGVSEATVRRWEKGTHFPDAWELRSLTDVLAVSADQLLHPEPLTDRERAVLRRGARAVSRVRDPGARAD